MIRSSFCAISAVLVLSGCEEKPEEISLGSVDEASYVEKTGEPWPLTIAGGELFCSYREVSLGDNYMFYIKADDGETYALNVTAQLLLNDGDAKNWEDIWKRNAEDTKNISLKPLRETYISDDCKKG